MPKHAILGLGYTGLRVLESLQEEFQISSFSRETTVADSEIYDFGNAETVRKFVGEYENSPFDSLIITFPLHSIPTKYVLPKAFSKVSRRKWLLGTTSIYRREGEIRESTPKNPEHERFEIEEKFLESGGKILRLSGIYGPSRNPADWIRKGLVRKSKRQLNLCHISDITEVIKGILSDSQDILPPELVFSDNQWHTWWEIFQFLEEKGRISNYPEVEPDREDAFVDSDLIRKFLPGLQTKDFWRELEKLEESP
ncbi:hypothetical protein EHO60_10560 [Leptospira fletcheri]|uniref:Uncharacterized protein n=1 Tax=Leptospira fletcheri TaxID=2484981 RepID=A0A4R9GFE5_9LEPT|nr:hypothetical protein [Leptospira fletcheri]TGK10271.1 hypothetical protein EHO60_10560 [Leptospira fletcheri]